MPARNGLAVTSMILGVLSLMFIMTGLSIPVGALGVLTALLSRGSLPMERQAVIGLAVSLLSIALGICVLIWSFRMLSATDLNALITQYQELYGLSTGS